MNTRLLTLLLLLLLAAVCAWTTRADIAVPTDGSDGDLILADTGTPREVVIDLALAVTGSWDAPQAQPLQPDVGGVGTYDPAKWVVVFKYNTVHVGKNVTLKFKNHGSRAPVVWLVKGNVEIEGGLLLTGAATEQLPSIAAEPGPGGFRGAASPNYYSGFRGAGPTKLLGLVRGFSTGVPLIGGHGDPRSYGRAAGGGAILIASRRIISVSGDIEARGGAGWGGSGVIRLVADEVGGSGFLDTYGYGGLTIGGRLYGGGGVRLEANRSATAPRTRPDALIVPPANPPVIWPAANAPTARILSVASSTARPDPRAHIQNHPEGPDTQIQTNGPARVLIETRYFSVVPEAKVLLHVDSNLASRQEVLATPVAGGSFEQSLWEAHVTMPPGFSTLIVHAVSP